MTSSARMAITYKGMSLRPLSLVEGEQESEKAGLKVSVSRFLWRALLVFCVQSPGPSLGEGPGRQVCAAS